MIETTPSLPLTGDLSSEHDTSLALSLQTTWDLSTIFPSIDEWNKEAAALSEDIKQASAYVGKLGTSATILLEAIQQWDMCAARASRLSTYADLAYFSDTRDSSAQALTNRAGQINAETAEAFAFVHPEIVSVGAETIAQFVDELPELKQYEFLLSEIVRFAPYTRSAEIQALLASLSPLRAFSENTHTALNNADLRFEPITSNNTEIPLSHGSIERLLESPDANIRSAVFERQQQPYLSLANTFAATLTQQAQTSLLFAKASGYRSTLERVVFQEDLATEVFSRVIEACDEHRGVMQRYFNVKAKILGLEKLRESDISAPLGKTPPSISYARARELVIEGVAPLGEEYQRIARSGLYEDRWVDAFSREGKYSNAFSTNSYLTSPRILLHYNDTARGVGILAHELGHSVHSFLTNRSQPNCYSGYSMLVAETASNLNQVLVRDAMTKSPDPNMQLAALDEAFYIIHRYLFLFPTLSKVEHFVHNSFAERQSVSSNELRAFSSNSFATAYGDTVDFNPDHTGIRWAQYGHLFAPYYLFKYGVGISAGMALGQQILDGDTSLRDNYLRMLESGSSRSTDELFKMVGIDITSPEPYQRGFSLVSQYVDQLEKLANNNPAA